MTTDTQPPSVPDGTGQRERPAGFVVTHADDAGFADRGLRRFFSYRDLGIREATAGAAVAHVIRANGEGVVSEWHHHDVQFQIVYVLRGWIRFEYEGVGEVLLRAGSCVHQPPGIRHRELAHASELEMLEVVAPADFATHTHAVSGPSDQ